MISPFSWSVWAGVKSCILNSLLLFKIIIMLPTKKSHFTFAFFLTLSFASFFCMAQQIKENSVKPANPRGRAAPVPSKLYFPQPWVGGQSRLPPNYSGIDVKWLYKTLSVSASKMIKSEFETAEEYGRRLRDQSALPAPLNSDDEYSFRIAVFELMHRLSYDADTEQFSTAQFGMICLDAEKSPELTEKFAVCDVSSLEKEEEEYVGSNSYGSSREIRRRREHSFGLAISKSDSFAVQFLKEYRGFQDRFSIPRDLARLTEGRKIGLIFVGRLVSPQFISGRQTIIIPTISNPSDIRVKRTAVHFKPSRIVYFMVETGEILFERII